MNDHKKRKEAEEEEEKLRKEREAIRKQKEYCQVDNEEALYQSSGGWDEDGWL